MKLWVDKVNDPPYGYKWAGSVEDAIAAIIDEEDMYRVWHMNPSEAVELVSISNGIKNHIDLIDWMQDHDRKYTVMLHNNEKCLGSIYENGEILESSPSTKKLKEITENSWTLTICENYQ